MERALIVRSAHAEPDASLSDSPPPAVLPARSSPRWTSLLRLGQWAHFLALPFATLSTTDLGLDTTIAAARGVAIATAVLAYGYVQNAAADRHMDRDPRKNPLTRAGAPLSVDRLTIALAGLALALAWMGGWLVVGATLVSLGSGWLYSSGPRLKGVPWIGTLLNASAFGPLLFVGARSDAALPVHTVALAALFVVLLLENQLIHEAADIEEDLGGGVRTTFSVLGPRGAAVLTSVLGVLASLCVHSLLRDRSPSPWVHLATAIVGCTFALLVPLGVARWGADPKRMGRLRTAQRFLALFAGAAVFAWVTF